MKRVAGFWAAIVLVFAAGFGCSQLLLSSAIFRDEIGEFFGRGRLVALVDDSGIYQVDLNRRLAELAYLAGIEEGERTKTEREAALTGLIVNVAAQTRASGSSISGQILSQQFNLIRSQLADEKAWRAALNRSGCSSRSIRSLLNNNLTTSEWLAKQIASQISVTDDERREFYDSHRDQFFLPERRNVSHVFLAAPPETPPEVVETKRAAIEVLAARLAANEDFATLAAQNSEDDATKLLGGELDYFTAKRMPPDFVEAAAKMRPGEISQPIRTRLGFHILKLIDIQAPRQLTFDEVRNDIAVEIANTKREGAVEKLRTDLRKDASYLRQF